jgi:hypothetical protein
MNWSVVCIGV